MWSFVVHTRILFSVSAVCLHTPHPPHHARHFAMHLGLCAGLVQAVSVPISHTVQWVDLGNHPRCSHPVHDLKSVLILSPCCVLGVTHSTCKLLLIPVYLSQGSLCISFSIFQHYYSGQFRDLVKMWLFTLSVSFITSKIFPSNP